jgi:hypothetical protein
MPIDPVLPHSLDDEYGPGAEQAEMADVHEDELAELEDLIREEMAAIIGDYANDERGSTIRDLQPTEAIIQAMATAAAQVLVAFERGSRIGN